MAGAQKRSIANHSNPVGRLLRNEHAFTSIEIMMTLTILLLVMAGFISLFMLSNQSWQGGLAGADRQQNARFALDRIAEEIRYATLLETDPGTAGAASIRFLRPEESNSVVYRLAGEEIVRETKFGSTVESHQKVALGITELMFTRQGQTVTIFISAQDDLGEYSLSTSVYLRNLDQLPGGV